MREEKPDPPHDPRTCAAPSCRLKIVKLSNYCVQHRTKLPPPGPPNEKIGGYGGTIVAEDELPLSPQLSRIALSQWRAQQKKGCPFEAARRDLGHFPPLPPHCVLWGEHCAELEFARQGARWLPYVTGSIGVAVGLFLAWVAVS